MRSYRTILGTLLLATSFSAMAAPHIYKITFPDEAPVKVVLGDSDMSEATVTSHATVGDKPAGVVHLYSVAGQASLDILQRRVEVQEYVNGEGHVGIPETITAKYHVGLPSRPADKEVLAQWGFEGHSPTIVIACIE